MNIFKELYLRMFKGYWKMSEFDMMIIKLHFMFTDRMPEIIPVRNYYLVSKPKKRA